MSKLQLIFCLLIISILQACNSKEQDISSSRPNIIVFLADDLGYGDLGCYGNPIIKTPGLDKFASEGVLLTDCHSAGTVCSPSRAGLLTGRNPYRIGFYYIQGSQGCHLLDKEITIAELLGSSGYETSFYGKWHLSRLEKNRYDEPGPGDQGFDYWFGTTHNSFGGPENCTKFIRNGLPVEEVDGWYCDVIVDEASEWLRNIRNKEKPFFMYICSHEPHTPIAPPASYSDMYDNEEVDLLEESVSYGGVSRPEIDISANKKEYYGTVTQLDNAFSKLLDAVNEEGLRENTLIIFTSDNGPEHPVTVEESLGLWYDPIREKCFGTPGIYRGMKRYPWDGGHRVPGIVRWPGRIPANSVSDKLFNGTDIAPVLCDLAGIEMPSDRAVDGVNAFNAFLDRETERELNCFWIFPTHEDTHFRMPHLAMREGNYTLVGWFPGKSDNQGYVEWMKQSVPERFELFDLKKDPGQQNDLSGKEEELMDKMIPRMLEQWTEIRDEGPIWAKNK
jgi:arylsulfatase A